MILDAASGFSVKAVPSLNLPKRIALGRTPSKGRRLLEKVLSDQC